MRILIPASIVFSWIFVGPSLAALYQCDEPDPPYCLTAYGTFDEEWSFENCRLDMDRYQDEVDDLSECLKDTMEDAIEQYDQSVDYWNCMARHEVYCSAP